MKGIFYSVLCQTVTLALAAAMSSSFVSPHSVGAVVDKAKRREESLKKDLNGHAPGPWRSVNGLLLLRVPDARCYSFWAKQLASLFTNEDLFNPPMCIVSPKGDTPSKRKAPLKQAIKSKMEARQSKGVSRTTDTVMNSHTHIHVIIDEMAYVHREREKLAMPTSSQGSLQLKTIGNSLLDTARAFKAPSVRDRVNVVFVCDNYHTPSLKHSNHGWAAYEFVDAEFADEFFPNKSLTHEEYFDKYYGYKGVTSSDILAGTVPVCVLNNKFAMDSFRAPLNIDSHVTAQFMEYSRVNKNNVMRVVNKHVSSVGAHENIRVMQADEEADDAIITLARFYAECEASSANVSHGILIVTSDTDICISAMQSMPFAENVYVLNTSPYSDVSAMTWASVRELVADGLHPWCTDEGMVAPRTRATRFPTFRWTGDADVLPAEYQKAATRLATFHVITGTDVTDAVPKTGKCTLFKHVLQCKDMRSLLDEYGALDFSSASARNKSIEVLSTLWLFFYLSGNISMRRKFAWYWKQNSMTAEVRWNRVTEDVWEQKLCTLLPALAKSDCRARKATWDVTMRQLPPTWNTFKCIEARIWTQMKMDHKRRKHFDRLKSCADVLEAIPREAAAIRLRDEYGVRRNAYVEEGGWRVQHNVLFTASPRYCPTTVRVSGDGSKRLRELVQYTQSSVDMPAGSLPHDGME